ncbi:hypothetical protein BDZ89DRAFT_1064240 [Hymenopellis radicata]|nr:hypothetical protein BDZ89DRAFT_1064240 [Hymenopellis radicata]
MAHIFRFNKLYVQSAAYYWLDLPATTLGSTMPNPHASPTGLGLGAPAESPKNPLSFVFVTMETDTNPYVILVSPLWPREDCIVDKSFFQVQSLWLAVYG